MQNKSILMNIQEYIKKYIQMTTAVFDFCVDVVDENFIRVAGTRDFHANVGEKLKYARIFPTVIRENKVIFISTTEAREECKQCKGREECGDNARLYCPIVLDGQVIGAISLRADTAWQNHEIRKNVERYTEFAKTMCDMIALKVKEYVNAQQLNADIMIQEALMNAVKEGVMLLDSRHNIIYMNKRCEYMLGCNIKQIAYLQKNHMFSLRQESSQAKDKTTYLLKIREKRIILNGHTHYINDIESNEVKFVFVFSDIQTLQEELILKKNVHKVTFNDLPNSSELFNDVIERCKAAAYTGRPVLLIGERGTGKELLAQAIHNEGLYHEGMYITASHGTALQELLEKAIFDPENAGGGMIQNSKLTGNTIFVDDIASLSWENQIRLTTIIHNCSRIHTQVICGANINLKEQVINGNFSPELYYALELYTIIVPPLRMRGNDLKIYINRFMDEANVAFGKKVRLTKDLEQMLLRYSWRGNIRELSNFIFRLVDSTPIEDDEASAENMPGIMLQKLQSDAKESFDLRAKEKELIVSAMNTLETKGYSKQQIADELGIGVATLYRKLKDYDIQTSTVYK